MKHAYKKGTLEYASHGFASLNRANIWLTSRRGLLSFMGSFPLAFSCSEALVTLGALGAFGALATACFFFVILRRASSIDGLRNPCLIRFSLDSSSLTFLFSEGRERTWSVTRFSSSLRIVRVGATARTHDLNKSAHRR